MWNELNGEKKRNSKIIGPVGYNDKKNRAHLNWSAPCFIKLSHCNNNNNNEKSRTLIELVCGKSVTEIITTIFGRSSYALANGKQWRRRQLNAFNQTVNRCCQWVCFLFVLQLERSPIPLWFLWCCREILSCIKSNQIQIKAVIMCAGCNCETNEQTFQPIEWTKNAQIRAYTHTYIQTKEKSVRFKTLIWLNSSFWIASLRHYADAL